MDGIVRTLRETRLQIRASRKIDLPHLLRIYNEAIIHSPATFDLSPQTMKQRRAWYDSHDRSHPILVATAQGNVVGYASLSKFRDKAAYSKTAETSVYVDNNFRGRGIGSALMKEIIHRARGLHYHTLVAAIVPPNRASIELHKKLSYKHSGTLKEVGYKFQKWQDVEWFQLCLED